MASMAFCIVLWAVMMMIGMFLPSFCSFSRASSPLMPGMRISMRTAAILPSCRRRKSLGGVLREHGFETLLLQGLLQHPPDAFFVIYYENSFSSIVITVSSPGQAE